MYKYCLTARHFFEHLPGRPSHWPLIDCGSSRWASTKSYRFVEDDVRRLAEAVWGGQEGIEAETKRRQSLREKPYATMTKCEIRHLLPFMIEQKGDPEADEWVATARRSPGVEQLAKALEELIHPDEYLDMGFGLFD
ncbi:hypothetical protein C1H76_8051 [Elsinoe australis]|uniref:Uncharacterized protein n=1 Tax=Elsinoe australis TaxID=40998 RepID=A0A4U7AP10_9PEZI|nr:hypothetical protein C1H76_8051 [Elsinoe australis]